MGTGESQELVYYFDGDVTPFTSTGCLTLLLLLLSSIPPCGFFDWLRLRQCDCLVAATGLAGLLLEGHGYTSLVPSGEL